MTANLSLPTSVEERISGWVRIQGALQAKLAERSRRHPTLTISREFGCEGFPLSLRLQQLFQQATGEPWSILDRALLEWVAQDREVPLQLLEHLENPIRYLESFGFHPRGAITATDAFAKLAACLFHFARAGNAIIIGRGGAILCQGLDNCFHFRLQASEAWRIDCLVRRLGISPREAEAMAKHEGRQRDHFVRTSLGADVADPVYYDAVFNNGRHGVEPIAAAILDYVRCGMKARISF